ncbi:ras-related protein ced-10-like [Musca autumnalis]|uniref:ras-related protein ced-10-like n=1 Tax=Musca autumnalis TaxID=221902 RepID=UPI003CEC1C96
MLPIKCVALGDGCAGKTSLLRTYVDQFYLEEYPTTIYEEYTTVFRLPSGDEVTLVLCDTGDLHVKPSHYTNADIFLLCYAIDEPCAFENIRERWLPEVRHYCPDVPIVLVGTKIDLRHDLELLRRKPLFQFATFNEGNNMAKEIDAIKYLECSAVRGIGIVEIFEFVTFQVMEQRSQWVNQEGGKGKCVLM